MLRVLLSACGALWAAACLSAAETRAIQVDGSHVSGQLQSLDSATATVRPAGSSDAVTLPLDGLQELQLDPPPLPDHRCVIVVDTGAPPQGTKTPEGTSPPPEGRASGKLKLRAGHHQIAVFSLHHASTADLEITIAGPELERQVIPAEMLCRVNEFQKLKRSEGFDDEGYRLPDHPENVQDSVSYRLQEWNEPGRVRELANIRDIPVTRYGPRPAFDLNLPRKSKNFAVTFQALLKIPRDGEYQFGIRTDGRTILAAGLIPAFAQVAMPQPADLDWVLTLRQKGNLIGSVTAWTADGLEFRFSRPPDLDAIPIPRDWIAGLHRGSVEKGNLRIERDGEPPGADTVYAMTADNRVQRVSGRVLGIDGDKLSFDYEGTARTIGLERVVAIHLAERKLPEPAGLGGLVFLSRGQRIPGTLATTDRPDLLELTTPWGAVATLPLRHVLRQQIVGGRLRWLSEMDPVEVQETGYFGQAVPWQRDASLTRSPIRIGGRAHARGIAQHAKSTLSWSLDGAFSRFQAEAGLLEPEGRRGHAEMRVLADGEVLWNSIVSADSPAQTVDLDVSGRQQLTLEVDFAERFDVSDHVGWGSARLLRTSP